MHLYKYERFSDFTNDNEFINLPLARRKLTLSNKHERAAMSRIDRFLISKEWDEHFVGAI